MNFTLIVFQECEYYYDDHERAELNVCWSRDEFETITHQWAQMMSEESGKDMGYTLLINGLPRSQLTEAEQKLHSEIENTAKEKAQELIETRRKAREECEERKRREKEKANELVERQWYQILKAKYGDQT